MSGRSLFSCSSKRPGEVRSSPTHMPEPEYWRFNGSMVCRHRKVNGGVYACRTYLASKRAFKESYRSDRYGRASTPADIVYELGWAHVYDKERTPKRD